MNFDISNDEIKIEEFKIKETEYDKNEIIHEYFIYKDFYGYKIYHMIKDKIGYSINGYINIT